MQQKKKNCKKKTAKKNEKKIKKINMWGKYCNQTKIMQGKDCSNSQYFFFFLKKATKLSFQPA